MRKLHLTETECARHVSRMSAPLATRPRPHLPTSASRDIGISDGDTLSLGNRKSLLTAVGHHGAAIWDERHVLAPASRVSFSPLGPGLGPGERPSFSSPIKSFTARASHSFSTESGEHNILITIHPTNKNKKAKVQSII